MTHRLASNAVWQKFGDHGPAAHFYHANGFPLGVYTPFLTALGKKCHLKALTLRPTWPGIGLPPKSRSWQIYADDLIEFVLENYHEPIIGIGHSMGATCTILAAHKRPDLFKALVLIEPAMVAKHLAILARLLPKSLMNLTAPAKTCLKKQDAWPSREDFYNHCKTIRGYRRFSQTSFAAMADHGVVQQGKNRFQLAFPKIWEAHNYTQPPNVMKELTGLPMPCVAIRAKPSVFFTQDLWEKWQRRCPETIFLEDLGSGHLLPLERPEKCAEMVVSGLFAHAMPDLT